MKQFCPQGHDTFIVGRTSSGSCRECNKQAQRRYQKKHLKKVRIKRRRWVAAHPEQARIIMRRSRGMTNVPAEPAIGTPCEICGRPLNKIPFADHDHKTNKFRGWLCRKCNTGIGMLNDDPTLLYAAIQYLSK